VPLSAKSSWFLPGPLRLAKQGAWRGSRRAAALRWGPSLLAGLLVASAAFLAACATGYAQDAREAPREALSFVDADGHVVLSTDFPGKWLLIYFGYMHCSDLCPTGLSVLHNALDQIGPAASQVQPLFVTVDPERDRGPELRRFAQAFDERLLPLSGTLAEIKRAAAALGVAFEKVAQPGSDYVVDHSSNYVLIDPMHRRVRSFRIAEAHLLAAKLIELMSAAGTPLGPINNLGAYR
jgi:cytochrome oxidase Cu insertion factor (SCO1/SenC/PrrC family)